MVAAPPLREVAATENKRRGEQSDIALPEVELVHDAVHVHVGAMARVEHARLGLRLGRAGQLGRLSVDGAARSQHDANGVEELVLQVEENEAVVNVGCLDRRYERRGRVQRACAVNGMSDRVVGLADLAGDPLLGLLDARLGA